MNDFVKKIQKLEGERRRELERTGKILGTDKNLEVAEGLSS